MNPAAPVAVTTGPASSSGFGSNVLWMSVTLGLARALDLATGILTARLLGPHDRGLYSLLLMIPHTIESILRLGVGSANVYMICRGRVSSTSIVSNSILLALAFGTVPLLLLPFRDLVGAHLLANVDQNYVTLAVLLVPFYLLATYTGSILHAFNRFAVLNRRTVLASALRLLGTALVVVVLQQGLFGAFLVHVLVGVLAAFWLLPFLVRLTSASIRPDVKLAAATVRFGTKSHLQTLLAALHLRLDHFVVAFFLGPSEVAFYAIATHMAEAMIAVSGPISTVLYPRLASMDDTRMHETTLTVCRHVLVLQVLVGIAIAVLARFAVTTLYGAEYLPAVQPLFILLPGIAMLSLFNVLARNFTSRNKQQTTIVAGLIGLTANVVLNLLLTPRLGIDGTALASTVSYSLAATVLLLFFRVHSGARLTALFTVQRSDVRFYGRLLARLAARPARV